MGKNCELDSFGDLGALSDTAVDARFRRYGSRLMGLIRGRMGPSLRRRLESRDVLQQTLLKAYQRLDQFAGAGDASWMAWLGAIARNEIRDHAKFHRREGRDAGRDVPLEVAAGVPQVAPRSEVSRLHLQSQARALERAIRALDRGHRDVLVLRRFEELSYPEIGRILSKSPDACRMLYSRAMAALTLELGTGPERA
ncbi:MAG: RNA polymerase sigma factor [Acidobacteriota bacterium]